MKYTQKNLEVKLDSYLSYIYHHISLQSSIGCVFKTETMNQLLHLNDQFHNYNCFYTTVLFSH